MAVDRANSKHGRHLDEQMAREVRSYLEGRPGSARRSDQREPEPRGLDNDPTPASIPRPDPLPHGGSVNELSDATREQRSQFGVYLPRSLFPADRDRLLTAAVTGGAPDDLIADLDRLPDDRAFVTVAEVWAQLGYAVDRRF
jgi:hypothetical protein